jgi:hypothetical protein
MKRSYVVGSLFACILSFAVSIGIALSLGHRSREGSQKQVRNDRSELQRDADRLASDVSDLRNLLLQHQSQEHIAELRDQVRQDWHQIVLDRGHADLYREDQIPNLVNRRHKRNALSG